MDPGQVLEQARQATFEGRHEEALRHLIWFHEHALDYDRAHYGVRLSFALGYWADLAKVYAHAKRALQSAKSHAASELLEGRGNRDLFHDVASINRELRRPVDTYKLFRALRKQQPALAQESAHLAIDSIVEAGDFKLASQYLPHPEAYLLWLSDGLNKSLESAGAIPSASRRRDRR